MSWQGYEQGKPKPELAQARPTFLHWIQTIGNYLSTELRHVHVALAWGINRKQVKKALPFLQFPLSCTFLEVLNIKKCLFAESQLWCKNSPERAVPHLWSHRQTSESTKRDCHPSEAGWPSLRASSGRSRRPRRPGWRWRCQRWMRRFSWWRSARWPGSCRAPQPPGWTLWPRSRKRSRKVPQHMPGTGTTAEVHVVHWDCCGSRPGWCLDSEWCWTLGGRSAGAGRDAMRHEDI